MTDNRTTELREKLAERGVDYRTTEVHGMTVTLYDSGGRTWSVTDHPNGYLVVNCVNFTPEQAIAATLGRGTCKPTEEDCCPICGEDLVKCNVGIGELGGAVELDPPIYHNYCPNCGAKVVER